MEYDNVLYIIGNGFDLHHGVKSSYKYFYKWLQKHDSETCAIYENVCSYDALWCDFEKGMAYVDRTYFLESGIAFLPDKDKDPDDYSMADYYLGSDVATSTVDNLLSTLKDDFHRWICSIHTPIDYEKHKLAIDYYAHFLSFNYTTYLESHYGIEKERINYIHGVKSGKSGSLIVGHGEDNGFIFKDWWNKRGYNKPHKNNKGRIFYKRDEIYKMYEGNTQYLPEFQLITESVETCYSDASKPVNQIIRRNQVYFQSLRDIRVIYVWAFSFSKVDLKYVQKLIEVNSDAAHIRWIISFFDDNDKHRATHALQQMGISIENIIFCKLQDCILNRL